MRRTCTALIVLTTLLLAVGSTGPSALAISSGPLTAGPDPVDFGTQAQGVTTPAQPVTLTNSNGSIPLTILNINASGDYNVTNDTCTGATLNPPGDSCTVGVTFDPSSNGSDDGSLNITDDDVTDGSTQSVDLNGSGVANQFSVSSPTGFGDQTVGTTSNPQSVTVSNNTDYPANPANPNITGSNSGDFNASGCSGSVAGNGTCTVNVTFSPNATGSRTATLNVAGQSVGLSGTGVQANANLSPANTTFGDTPVSTMSSTKNITLTNSGSGPLTYTKTTVSGADPGDFSVGDTNCASVSFVPANGGTCTITVQFVPTAIGHRTATVVVHDSAPSGTQSVNVAGTGTASSVAFAPTPIDFTKAIPAGTASPGHTVTVYNTTAAIMPITSTVIAGTNPKNFIETGDTCTGKTLQPGAKCTLKVKFAPSSAGLRTALLEVNDSGPIAPHVHDVTLNGNATYPNNPKSIVGSVGCSSARISWVAPSATRFAGTIVVRNHAQYPTSVGDGTRVPHTSGIATDKGLKHFTTYYYRVFATYHSLTHPGNLNYSQGARLKERTGQVCTPQNGATIHTVTPKFTWLPAPTKHGYAFVLQRGSDTIDVNYTPDTQWRLRATWRYNKATHRLVVGDTYTFYLYAYPLSHPNGLFIGKTTFTVRR
jgi:hypothetical protein